MDVMMNLFFIFGAIFFVSWFVFMVVLTAVTVIIFRRFNEFQVELQKRMESRKSDWLMTLIPLIPSIIDAGRSTLKRK